MSLKKIVVALSLLAAVAHGPAAADSDSDYERARAAMEAGLIVPLSQALSKVEGLYEGDVLEVELENEENENDDNGEQRKSGFIYEIKLLTPQGNVLKIKIDAKTTELLSVKGRDAENARRH